MQAGLLAVLAVAEHVGEFDKIIELCQRCRDVDRVGNKRCAPIVRINPGVSIPAGSQALSSRL